VQSLDNGVPFATFIMRVVGLVVDDQQMAGAAAIRSAKSIRSCFCAGGFGPSTAVIASGSSFSERSARS
jgi:hypothetical protein